MDDCLKSFNFIVRLYHSISISQIQDTILQTKDIFLSSKERKVGKTALFPDTFAQKTVFCAKVRIMLDLSEFSWYTMRENR